MPTRACSRRAPVRAILLLAACSALAACQTMAPPRADETLAPDVEAPALPPGDARVYGIVSGESEVRVLAYRGGALAKFGHNHVIRSTAVEGTVYLGRSAALSGFELKVPLESFEVDPPAARRDEGREFEGELSDEAVRDTRGNMLGEKVLDVERYPELQLRSVSLNGPLWNPDVRMRLTLHGTTRDVTAPVAVVQKGQRLVVIGSFTVRQSDFGIEPFTALNGGLAVEDVIRVRARLVAEAQ